MKIYKINVKIPHTTNVYTIYSDNLELVKKLKIYYGSFIDEFDYIGTNTIRYIEGILSIKKQPFGNAGVQNENVALSNIIMYIRNHIITEPDWFLYHGACSVINGKTYLFIGHSTAGKTTLSTFLHYQPNVISVSEDICIVNYKELTVESIQRPFFLRQKSYDLLTGGYDLDIHRLGIINYNINEKIIANMNSIQPGQIYKIDEIIFLHLNDARFKKERTGDISGLLENSYNSLEIYKGICSASIIRKKIPMFQMYYYDLIETYKFLTHG